MLNNEFLKDLSSRITRLMPVATDLREEVEKNVQATLQGAFARFNLVTREEFDAQMKVLARAEETIARLEAKLNDLEQAGSASPGGGENDN